MGKFYIRDIEGILKENLIILGNKNISFNNVKPINNADEYSLTWLKNYNQNKGVLATTNSKIIICEDGSSIDEKILEQKCIILVKKTKLSFSRIVEQLFSASVTPGVHPTAFNHHEAKFSI